MMKLGAVLTAEEKREWAWEIAEAIGKEFSELSRDDIAEIVEVLMVKL